MTVLVADKNRAEAIHLHNLAKDLYEAAIKKKDPPILSEAIFQWRHALRFGYRPAETVAALGSALSLSWLVGGPEGYLEESEFLLREALDRGVDCRLSLSKTLRHQAKYSEARKFLDQVLADQPDSLAAHAELAWSLLRMGEWKQGFDEMLALCKIDSPKFFEEIGCPLWDGKPTEELLVWIPHGAGDVFQFCRYVALARDMGLAKHITFLPTHAGLVNILGCLGPGITTCTLADEFPDPTAHAPLMWLPSLLWPELPECGYLRASGPSIYKAKVELGKLPPGKKIGVNWRGDPSNIFDPRRSFDASWMPGLSGPDRQLIVLQKNYKEDIRGWPLVKLGQWYDDGDWDTTAGVIHNLDLVISCESGVCHLAGAMGKKMWIVLPEPTCWRWGIGSNKTRWYPGAKLFRQKLRGEWSYPFDCMRMELEWAQR